MRLRGRLITAGKRGGHLLGLDVRRHRPAAARRSALLSQHSIATVLDVGGNRGQYALGLRANGYRGHIISFEPLPSAFSELAAAAHADSRWEALPVALSSRTGEADFNVAAGGGEWSSMLAMRPAFEVQGNRIIHTNRIHTKRLDDLGLRFELPALLKMDVQGHELAVLEGAAALLDRVQLVETELSVTPLYEGQPLIRTMLECLDSLNYKLVSLEPGFFDPATGCIFQFDGIFVRQG